MATRPPYRKEPPASRRGRDFKPERQAGARYTVDLRAQRKRADKAWTDRLYWNSLYNDAYEFAVPYRRPASSPYGRSKGAERIERVFDATAIESSFLAAAQLQQDLFPPEFFKLAAGPVARLALEQTQVDELEKQLEKVTATTNAFFQTGEFDLATNETCIDLQVGTGILFPVEGDDDNPIRFVCIPFDEVALEVDAFGAVTAMFWRTMLSVRTIYDTFPDGRFPKEFMAKHNQNPEEELEICQDFVRDPKTKRWKFCAYLKHQTEDDGTIEEAEYVTQPFAAPRYHRVPGEPYGRGPILLALPTIKTLNKAVELTLKAAAVQMLGLWGYRPGGAFNPDTVRLAPGEFWPMTATGGVLGPDIVRLDPASGRIDVSQLITQELRTQVQSMLHDDRLPEQGATPPSATEIMARMKRIARNYLGAYARLVNEIIPPIVRRVMEILYRRKLIVQKINIDTLLIKIDVLSPIAAAVKATAHTRIIDFIQLVSTIKGPQQLDLIVKVDEALRRIGSDLMPPSLMRTTAEQKAMEAAIQAAVAQVMQAQQEQAAAAAPGAGNGAAQAMGVA